MPKEFDSSFHSILFSYLQTHLSLFPNSFKSPYKKKKIARSALDKSWIHRRTNIKTLCKCNERWIKCNERCRRRKGWGEDEKSKVIHGRKGREKGDVSRVSGRALPYVTSLRVLQNCNTPEHSLFSESREIVARYLETLKKNLFLLLYACSTIVNRL